MSVYTMVVMIVAIVAVSRVLRERYRAMNRLPARPDASAEAENLKLHGEVARLNERIRVLERLATDPAKRLSDEIESLKDR
jgi:flagellar motility protein MotE (MotC chaperone)